MRQERLLSYALILIVCLLALSVVIIILAGVLAPGAAAGPG